MGTRGAYGFLLDGKEKVTYNHSDSYPEGLGEAILAFVKQTPDEELRKIAQSIELVNEDAKPTQEQINQCSQFADTHVSTGRLDDWYVLLRNTQGDLNVYKKGLKYMIDSHTFLGDSLFCEWAYIINLDTMELEIYEGFNKNSSAPGRYAAAVVDNLIDEKYYGVRLVKSVPLTEARQYDSITAFIPENKE